MPFKFTSTLQKVEINLGESKLTAQQKTELLRRQREHAVAAQ